MRPHCAVLFLRGGGGNRTRVQGFAGPCLSHSATPPYAGDRAWSPEMVATEGGTSSGRRDSNPRPSPWQGDALPAALRPRLRGPFRADRRGTTLLDARRAFQFRGPWVI